ncbi:MAG: type I-F CRISPR-associated helicase Cas3f [Dissulfuribacterales bacterium]
MMVTFISQCEKRALNKTRRVLDSFADRIGDRTWQTVITDEGLQAVRKLLRKTASKNTAVACHWIRSRSRSELLWIVGNRRKFNHDGIIPVNTTEKDILHQSWENDWHLLPLIKNLTALGALLHDWGKSTGLFQKKLGKKWKTAKRIGDPLRHEWISVLFFRVIVGGKNDHEWLTSLMKGDLNERYLIDSVKSYCGKEKIRPLRDLPQAAGIIAWLILSHHRLPAIKRFRGKSFAATMADIFKRIEQGWGYENRYSEEEFRKNLTGCFEFPNGLPSGSTAWLKQVKKYAGRLLECLDILNSSIEDGSWRLVLHYCRLSLMLGDHYYSSLEINSKKREKISGLELFANTDRKTGERMQTLDEHLVGVTKQAVRIAHTLPVFENTQAELPRVFDVKALRRKSPKPFSWQDTAVAEIKHWRSRQEKLNHEQFGFFAVNMASTGKGKTFANAKIMRALSPDEESLRYALALGLRTLTLQTGDEYRERIGLENDELAVLIGSRAVLNLHNKKQKSEEETDSVGSESMEALLENELYFESTIPDDFLRTTLRSEKDRQFLYAPVLCCTIDHFMGATEVTHGGRWILPVLRLMSSDLVIDEIDDFTGKDLIAIGRLIHLAGMLGRKVMISSATIPPDMAEGYFNAYQAGWSVFSRMRNRRQKVGCAWIDEFGAKVSTMDGGQVDYRQQHQLFVKGRLDLLRKEIVKRKAEIVRCEFDESKEESIDNFYYSVILKSVVQKHRDHFVTDNKSGKQVSFGVVRMANIKPCIALTRYLLNAEWPHDVEIRCMAYHSQQVLIMRNAQEKHLDEILKRKTNDSVFANPLIRSHLGRIKAKNVIFVLVATPVEEVGRDHDFDWAVVEPSSYRSFIQLAGRVLRHRTLKKDIAKPNMALMQFNLRGMMGKKIAFFRPGYESDDVCLVTHDLTGLLDETLLNECLDATPRISRNKDLNPHENLVDLEHYSIHQRLTDYENLGPESMQGWLKLCWWLTAIPQQYVRFRQSYPQMILYLYPKEGSFGFVEKNCFGMILPKERQFGIRHKEELTKLENKRLWMFRDYEALLKMIDDSNVEKAALIYGELSFPTYGDDLNNLSYIYSSQFGLSKNS